MDNESKLPKKMLLFFLPLGFFFNVTMIRTKKKNSRLIPKIIYVVYITFNGFAAAFKLLKCSTIDNYFVFSLYLCLHIGDK